MVDRDHSKFVYCKEINHLINNRTLFLEPRGFGFVTFDVTQAIDNVLVVPDHYIEGKLVECKKAVPKETPS